MGSFTTADLDRLVEGGCPECGSKRCELQSYVAQVMAVQGGELVGKPKWAYDGEAFVEGIFEATCADCDHTHYTSSLCPACGAADGLERAMTTENAYPIPASCPRCGTTDLHYFGFVPAETKSEGKKSERAHTDTALDDPGFHGFRADCKSCGTVAKHVGSCALCGA